MRQGKTALFIDGANLYATAKALGVEINYETFDNYFNNPIRKMYFTAIKEENEHQPIRPLLDWLEYHGFDMISKPAKIFIDEFGKEKIKGNMDVEITVAMMVMSDHVENMVLFTGDGDFASVVDEVKRKGIHVTVVSSLRSQPPMVADELRRKADVFKELQQMQEIHRPRNSRSVVKQVFR